MKIHDILIIGGGQAGLSAAYFLNRTDYDYLILDDKEIPGGAWLQTWDSLHLFSPTDYSSLSGWQMPKSIEEYSTKLEFLAYLKKYEERYTFPIQRNTKVSSVKKEDQLFHIETNQGDFYSKLLISATGTAGNPFIPSYPKIHMYKGRQLHSVAYKNPMEFIDQKVVVVGNGNSGAQILAELSKVTDTKWLCKEEPTFLPEEIDGRYLFHQSNARFFNQKAKKPTKNLSLSKIVQVPSVRVALQNDVYKNFRLAEEVQSFSENGIIWTDHTEEKFDAIVWCTGFKSDLKHLRTLPIWEDNRIPTKNTQATKEPHLWLLGYGNWTGFASATIYGVGKTARQTVKEIKEILQ